MVPLPVLARRARPRHCADWFALLNEVEQTRWKGYRRPIDRDRFLTGVAMTRSLVAERTGEPPEAVPLERACRDCGRPHGPPRIETDPPLRVSVTHSGAWVLLAAADRPIGVDVELVGPGILEIERILLSEHERDAVTGLEGRARQVALTRAWVRKEAVLKALGTGMRSPMSELDIVHDSSATTARGRGVPGGVRVQIVDLTVDDAHLASLAVVNPDQQVRVHQQSWPSSPLRDAARSSDWAAVHGADARPD